MHKRIFIVLLLLIAESSYIAAIGQQTAESKERRLERGSKVIVQNTTGKITITGWDRDTVQATGIINQKPEPALVSINEDSSQSRNLVITLSPLNREVDLNVKAPRYAELEVASIIKGDIEVVNIEGSIVVRGVNSNIKLNRIGSLEAHTDNGDIVVNDIAGPATLRTISGNITARNIKGGLFGKTDTGSISAYDVTGLTDLSVASGDITVRNAGSDIRVSSISGAIDVQCAKGDVTVANTSGLITLARVDGDVEATTTSGSISFTGVMRERGRYRLKSLSSDVRMIIQADAPGFTVTLSTYSGRVTTDFPIKIDSSLEYGPVNRRITGRYKDGESQVLLDSFSGSVELTKAAAGAVKDCRRQ
jgi:DUF4097 and DUF4098 domain-containing protein YvlB